MEKDVYFYKDENMISFDYTPNKSVVIGTTDESLESFLVWMRADWMKRGCDTNNLPKIKEDN